MSAGVKIVVLTGPTASGKTALAVALARASGGEIVSVDSRQVYRGLDLGSGKDLGEYGEIPYHLIDVADPAAEEYHLARFAAEARAAIADIAGRGKLPILCGGSTLYLDALVNNYALPGGAPDPEERRRFEAMTLGELAAELRRLGAPAEFHDWDNHLRLRRAIEIVRDPGAGGVAAAEYDSLLLGLYRPRREIHHRIGERLRARLEAGMVDEVRRLHDEAGVSWERLERFGLEYRALAEYLRGASDYAGMVEGLEARIRQFAKRQDIWFRKMEREGGCIHWLAGEGREKRALGLIGAFLANRELPEPELRMMNITYAPPSQK